MATTGFVFMLAFLGALALALARHPIYGLYAYIAVFYVHPPSRWWGAFLPDLRWSLLAAAVTLIAMLRLPADKTRPPWYSMLPAKLLIGYTLLLWIQLKWALAPTEQLDAAILFTKYVVLFYVIYRLVDSPAEVRRFMIAHVAGCTYLGVLAFTSKVSGRLEGVGGPGIDEANTLGMQFATGATIGAMLLLSEQKWLRIVGIGSIALVLNGIVLTGSRGAFLAMLCAGVVMFYFKPAIYKRTFYVFAVLGVILFFALSPPEYWQRIGTITTAVEDRSQADVSAESRFALIEAQLRMAARYPLGAGHRGTEALSIQYLDEKYLANSPGSENRTRSSHNTLMTTLVEQGVLGMTMWLMTWVWGARTLLRLRRLAVKSGSIAAATQVAGLAGALTALFVAGMFVDYLKVEVQVWLFALLSTLAVLMLREANVSTPATVPTKRPNPLVASAKSQRHV